MEANTPDHVRRVLERWLAPVSVFLASFAFLHHYQFLSDFIVGYDGYYHAKYAWLLRTEGFLREFPWAAHSIWAEHFADKELLYHVFLVPFTWLGDPALGIKWGTVVLAAAAMTSFYLILRLNRLRYPLLWLALLACSGSYFLWRLCAPRPQVLSILLLLWSIHLVLERRYKTLALVSFLYSLSYTGFHLPVLLALAASAGIWAVDRTIEWKAPATIVVSILAGMLCNPYFPDNFVIFWIQNLAVPWAAIRDGVSLGMGAEFGPMTTRQLIGTATAVVLPYFAAFFVAMVRPRRIHAKTAALFLMSLALIVMTMVTRRFAEYSVPVTLFFLASFFTDQLRDLDLRATFRRRGKGRARVVTAWTLILICLVVLHWRSYRETAPWFVAEETPLKAAALYLENHSEEGEVVFTCDWDDTPQLFFHNHHNRYPVFLDPLFMYYADPDLWQEWSTAASGGSGWRTYDVLAGRYTHGVCTSDYVELRQIIGKDPRIDIVLETDGAYVFRLNRDTPEISLDDLPWMGPD